MKEHNMKAYMWRGKNGDWRYMIGNYDSVQHARTVFDKGARFAIIPHGGTLNDAARIAREHARRMPLVIDSARRLGLPLAV